jgi:hypothetical protein
MNQLVVPLNKAVYHFVLFRGIINLALRNLAKDLAWVLAFDCLSLHLTSVFDKN